MKTLILFLILSIGITMNTQAQTSREENRQVIETFFVALEELDINKFITVWADEGATQLMPFAPEGFPSKLEGKEPIYNQYKGLPENYESMHFPRTIMPMEDPNKFIVQYKGIIPLGDGGEYNNDYIGLFELENGKIKIFTEYFNPIILLEAFGDNLQDNFNLEQ